MSYSSKAEKLHLSFCLKNCKKSIHYLIKVILSDSTGYIQNFETEKINFVGDDLSIIFTKKMSCTYYFEKKQDLRIQIIRKIPKDNNTNKILITERLTSLSSLITSPNSNYERTINENDGYKETISISLDKQYNNNSSEQNYSLFEYFKNGVKLSCFISLDFSSSPNNPTLDNTKINYELILKEIKKKITYYTKNHLFYSTGFGVKSNSSSPDKSIFNLNMNEKDSSINTIDKVIYHFNECIEKKLIDPDNKIILSSLIKKLTNDIYKLYEIRFYNVSFIIIRGNVEKKDAKKIIDKIIESSYLPLTIFVIGVGKNDYSETKKIIGGNYKTSRTGMERMRNNIFFINLIEDFSNNEEKMIIFCLQELNKQIIEFYKLIKSSPEKIGENNLDNIKHSFNLYNSSIWVEHDNSSINKELGKIYINDSGNPYKKDFDLGKYNKSKKENVSKDSYESAIEQNIQNNNKNNSNVVNDVNKQNKESKDETKIYMQKYTPTPYDSIAPAIQENPYVIQSEKKYIINATSIIDPNQISMENNPYLDDYRKQSMENMNLSNNSSDIKKINNCSGASEFNSTKNSEGIKYSNDLMYNNNYSTDGSYRK